MAVDLNTNLGIYGNNTTGYTNNLGTSLSSTNMTGSLFGSNPMYQMTTSNYEDDMMMPEELKISGMNNMLATASLQNTGSQTQGVQQATTFTSNQQPAQTTGTMDNFGTQVDDQAYSNYLVNRDANIETTETGNAYQKTAIGKKSLATLGFLAPATGKVVQLFKGGSFKELFKFKPLALATGALTLAGLGIGSLIDGYINNQRAKSADAQVQQQTATQVYQPMSIAA